MFALPCSLGRNYAAAFFASVGKSGVTSRLTAEQTDRMKKDSLSVDLLVMGFGVDLLEEKMQ